MAGPWEDYGAAPQKPQGPWSDYAPPPAPATEQSAIDKVLGRNGPRYQFWPERLARGVAGSLWSGATFPGDVMAGKDSPQNVERLIDLSTLGAPLNPAARAGDLALPGVKTALQQGKAVVPGTKELYAEAGKDFNAFRDSGLVLAPDWLARYAQAEKQKLIDAGIHPVDAANTFKKLDEIASPPQRASGVTAGNLKSFRESLGVTAQNFNPNAAKDQLAATRAIRGLDESVRGLSDVIPPGAPQDVLAGAPTSAVQAWERGRGNAGAAYRSNTINGELDRAVTGIVERAENRAQAANSGRNLDNSIRQKAEAILEKPKEVSGMNDAEIAALEGVVNGGPVRNSTRYVANLLGGGGGMGQGIMAGIGGGAGALATGTPTGAIIGAALPPIAGSALKTVENILGKRSMNKVDELMRTRSPLFEERSAQAPQAVPWSDSATRELAARLLLLQSQQR